MTSTKKLWTCPECNRHFAKRDQWHSCVKYSVDDLFKGKPSNLKETFDYLISEMKRFGTIRVDAVKGSINIAGKYHFAGVQVLKNSLKVGFVLERGIYEFPIHRTEKLAERIYVHSVKLAGKDDINAQLLGWLKEAYLLRK